VASALGIHSKMFITFVKIAINCSSGVIFESVVTIVDNRPSHTAENGLDHIKELSTRGGGATSTCVEPVTYAITLLDAIRSDSRFEICHDAASQDR
jgi:hypothetical protein